MNGQQQAMELQEVFGVRPNYGTRRAWLDVHSARIAALLDSEPLATVPGRLWRMRYWQDGELVVATLVQPTADAMTARADNNVKISAYIVRGYHHHPNHAAALQLTGRYSVDELVAFLRLDLVDPSDPDVVWTEETDYARDILVVRGLVAESIGRRQD